MERRLVAAAVPDDEHDGSVQAAAVRRAADGENKNLYRYGRCAGRL